jgi:hypothetical protein
MSAPCAFGDALCSIVLDIWKAFLIYPNCVQVRGVFLFKILNPILHGGDAADPISLKNRTYYLCACTHRALQTRHHRPDAAVCRSA